MILVVNDYDSAYSRFWRHLGGEVIHDPAILFKDPGSIKLVCFTGGEDVSPELYGHKNLGSYNSKARDEREVLIFEMAKKHNIPMTGICRGSQFLNVMCGGTMVQHLKKFHGGSHHQCRTFDGQTFEVTSSHHQMSVLGKNGIYLGWSEEEVPTNTCVYDGNLLLVNDLGWAEKDRKSLHVTEAFVYPELRIFAVQHHPEWQGIEEEAPQWTLKMIAEHCWGQKQQKTLET